MQKDAYIYEYLHGTCNDKYIVLQLKKVNFHSKTPNTLSVIT